MKERYLYPKILILITFLLFYQSGMSQFNSFAESYFANFCLKDNIQFDAPLSGVQGGYYEWEFFYANSPLIPAYQTQVPYTNYQFLNNGSYYLNIRTYTQNGTLNNSVYWSFYVSDCSLDPEQCIESFSPIPGETYVLSAWVKEGNSIGALTYDDPEIQVSFSGGGSTQSFKGNKEIIDGWQRVEQEFLVPAGASDISITLKNNGSGEVFFDDIRIHPFKATMKSFVYDPINLRLLAELDERNYATFYEYDEEGALIRIEKETERGRKTIQESSSNIHKE